MKRVVLHVDRLVLRGIAPHQRTPISTGLRTELTRLLATPGVPKRLSSLGTVDRVRAGNLSSAASAKPESTGTAIAQAVVKGITR
jgi:hypothetical protein